MYKSRGRSKGEWYYELVGDRDKPAISIKDIAFTIAANPMSDRMQRVKIYEV